APALRGLGLDQRLVLELLQGGIDRPGARAPDAPTALADLLNDLIAVPGLLGQQRERGGADVTALDPRAAHELRPPEPGPRRAPPEPPGRHACQAQAPSGPAWGRHAGAVGPRARPPRPTPPRAGAGGSRARRASPMPLRHAWSLPSFWFPD